MSRATKQQVEARTRDILRVLLDGAEPGWDLCEFVREQEQQEGSNWYVGQGEKPLSYSQIRRYAARAEELIRESCRTSRKKLLRQHAAMRRSLYAKAVSQGDVRAAASVLKDLGELLGLYPAKQTEVTGRRGAPIILRVVEEIVGREPAAQIGQVVEEVVTSSGNSDTNSNANQDGSAPPGAASLPPQ
jgi:hypothetical protein